MLSRPIYRDDKAIVKNKTCENKQYGSESLHRLNEWYMVYFHLKKKHEQ